MPKIPNTTILIAVTLAVVFVLGLVWFKKLTGDSSNVSERSIIKPSEYINLIIGIMSLGVALVFGAVATELSNRSNKFNEESINLSKAAYKLAEEQGKQKDELKALTQIVKGQDEQLKSLKQVVTNLETQNKITNKQLLQILLQSKLTKEILEKQSEQSDYVSGQLQFEINKANEDLQNAIIIINSGINQIAKTAQKASMFGEIDTKTISIDTIRDYLIESKSLLSKINLILDRHNNNLVLGNPDARITWDNARDLFGDLESTVDELNSKGVSALNKAKAIEVLTMFWQTNLAGIVDALQHLTMGIYEKKLQLNPNFREEITPNPVFKKSQ